MRVITGTAKGRRLETLEGEDVRPTTERIKEAVFQLYSLKLWDIHFSTFLQARDRWVLRQ